MSDYLNWEKISQEYYKQKLLQKEKFLEAINVNQINNIKDFDQKYLGVLQQSQNSSQTLKEFLGLQGFIKKNLNKYLVNPPDPPTHTNLPATIKSSIGKDPYQQDFYQLEEKKSQQEQQIFYQQHIPNTRSTNLEESKTQASSGNYLSDQLQNQQNYQPLNNTSAVLQIQNSLEQRGLQYSSLSAQHPYQEPTKIINASLLHQQTQNLTQNQRALNESVLLDNYQEDSINKTQNFSEIQMRNPQSVMEEARNMLQGQDFTSSPYEQNPIIDQNMNISMISDGSQSGRQNSQNQEFYPTRSPAINQTNLILGLSEQRFTSESELRELRNYLLQIQNDKQQLTEALSQLKQHQENAYQYICKNAEIFNKNELYQETCKYIDKLKKIKNQHNRCEKKMIEAYEIDEHIGFAIYLKYKEILDFKDPSPQIVKLYGPQIQQLKSILNENQAYSDSIQSIIEELDTENLEFSHVFGYQIFEENQDIGNLVLEILKNCSEDLKYKLEKYIRYLKFNENLPQEISQIKELSQIFVAIEDIDEEAFNKNLQVLNIINQDYASKLLQLLQVHYNELYSKIQNEQLASNITVSSQNNSLQKSVISDQNASIEQNIEISQSSDNQMQLNVVEEVEKIDILESIVNKNDIEQLVQYIKMSNFDNRQIFEILEKLFKQQNYSLYQGLIHNNNDTFKNDQDYMRNLGYIEKNYQLKDKLIFIQEKIDEMFNNQPHHAFSLYLLFRDKINLKNPIETQLEQQKTNDILTKVEVVLSSIGFNQNKIQEFQAMIQENQVNEILQFAQSLSKNYEHAYLQILEIIKDLSEEINQQVKKVLNFLKMKEEISLQGVELLEIEKYLNCIGDNKYTESINFINQILFMDSVQANGTLHILHNYFPEAVQLIPEYKFILLKDIDINTKRIVSALIDILENLKHNPQQQVNVQKTEEMNQMLVQIHEQNTEILESILDSYQTQVLKFGLQNPANIQSIDENSMELQSSRSSAKIDPNQIILNAINSQDKEFLLQHFENTKEELIYWALSKAYIFNTQLYESLIVEPVIINLDKNSYASIKKYLDMSKKPSQCQKKIDDYYEVNQHLAASLYVQYRNKIYLVDPHQIQKLKLLLNEFFQTFNCTSENQDDEILESFKDSEELKIALEELHMLFEERNLLEFIDKTISISLENQIVGNSLIDIVKKTSKILYQGIQKQQTYLDFENRLPKEITENNLISEFLKSLQNQDQEKVNKCLTLISVLNQEQTCDLLQSVENCYPSIYENFPQEQIILLQCPSNIKDSLKFVFSKTKESQSQVLIEQDIKKCENYLRQIYESSQEYSDKIIQIFGEKFKSMNIKLPQSIKEIQIETFKRISSILEVSNRSKKIKIEQYYEVDENFLFDQVEKQLLDVYSEKRKLPRQQLSQLLFHYMKRRLDFNFIVEKFLNIDTSFPITRSVLILYLLENADEQLRILIIVSLSLYIPIPLYGISWKQQDKKQNNQNQFEQISTQNEQQTVIIPKELIYVFERFKSVINFSISCNTSKRDYPQNTENFINKLFNKNFEMVNDQYSNFGTIELQFDYNFSKPQYIPVANCNGPLSISQLENIMGIFNIFIIHVNTSNEQDQELLNEYIQLLKSNSDEQNLIIILDHDSNYERSQFIQEQSSQSNDEQKIATIIYYFKVKPLQKTSDAMINILCDELQKLIIDFNQQNPDKYLANIKQRQDTLDRFNRMLKLNSIENNDVDDVIINVSNIIKKFESNSENLHSFEFLPMNYLFEKACQLNFSICFDNDLDSQSIKRKETERQTLLSKMENQEISPIINDLIRIITSHNSFGCFMIINKLIKGYSNDKLKQIYSKREELRDQIKQNVEQSQNSQNKIEDQEHNQKLQFLINQARDITNDIEKKSFSYEYIIRELYLLGQYRKDENDKSKYQKQYYELCYQNFQNTQPFEVIDGNNLAFVSEVYDELFKNSKDEIFVVGVIGPQSSGKSLLLNFLFGTQFQSSEGRCTKGVYGAIINVKTEGNKKRRILILDTEGIQAAEARDDRFDRRIVFYMLCVSHVVLICNRGEMNSQMAEILKLAAESISNLKENIINPKVFVVMNMLASTDNAALSECIQKLSSAISELGSMNNTQQLFQISSKNVKILPFAFDRSGKNEFIVNQPSVEFSVQLEPLKRKILECMQQTVVENGKDKMSTNQWFDFACKLWNFTEKFKGMMEYKNLEQKLMEASVKEKMNTLIQAHLEDKQQENKKIIDTMIIKDLQQFEGNQSIKFNIIFTKIESSILDKYQEIENYSFSEYKAFCQIKNVPSDIASRNQPILKNQMTYYKEQWVNQAREKVTLFIEQKSKKIGFAKLNEIISNLLKKQNIYTQEEAEELFEQQWNKIEEEIVSMTREESTIREQTHENVRNLYNQEMGTSYYADYQQENDIISQFYNLSNKALLNEFKNLNEGLLYFTGSTVIPNQQKLIGALNMNKKFIKNLKSNILYVKKQSTIYDWKKLLQERVDRKYIQKGLLKYLISKGIFYNSYNNDRSEQVKYMFQQLNLELNHVNIQLKGLFIIEAEELLDVLKSKLNEGRKIKNEGELQNLIEIYLDRAFYQEPDSYFTYADIEQKINFRDKAHYQFVRTSVQFDKAGKEIHKKFNINDYLFNCDGDILQNKYPQAFVMNTQNTIFIDKKTELSVLEKQYLTYLSNSSKSQQVSDKSETTVAGMRFVIKMLNLECIIEEIESIVIKKLKCDDIKEQNETITNLIGDLKTKKGDELKQKLRKLNRNVIQDVATDVKTIVQELNEDLDRFAFKLSEKGTSLIHQAAQVFLIALGQHHLIKIEQGSLENLRNGKQIQKQLFIAKLTSNQQQLDLGLAKKLAKESQQYLIQKYTQEALDEFRQAHQRNEQKFNKKDLVQEIEDAALTIESNKIPIKSYNEYKFLQNEEQKQKHNSKEQQKQISKQIPNIVVQDEEDDQIQDIVDYFIEPKQFFIKNFNIAWKNFSKPELQRIKENFSLKFKNSMLEIYSFFQQLGDLLIRSNTNEPSISLFITTDDSENDNQMQQIISQPLQNSNQENLKELVNKAATQYIIHMVKRDLPNDRIIAINNIKIRCGLDNKPLPIQSEINKQIDSLLILNIEQSLQGEQVSNIMSFIEKLLIEIDQILLQDLQLESDDQIIGEIMQLLKTKFIGCDEYCPLCRMQCDVYHNPNESIKDRTHECTQGHRIQGFGGNKNINGNAVLITCSDLKDSNDVTHEGSTMKWSIFQTLPNFKKWKFTVENQSELKMWKNKNITLWNHFGKLICEIYKRNDSMKGDRWQDLMKSVQAFMELICANIKIQKHSRITALTYEDNIYEVFEERIPDIELLDLITFKGGGTDFKKPIKYMEQCIQKHFAKYDKFVVCFMTDGDAGFPKKQLESISKDENIMRKLDFRCILQGTDQSGANKLKNIAAKLQGTMKECIDIEDLKEQFISLVPNIYQ
eukprot:403347401